MTKYLWLLYANSALVLANAGMWSWAFWLFRKGEFVYEPVKWIATTEFITAVIVALIGLVSFVISSITLRKERVK